ncbi:MAG: LysM peptidoglycan-binding domain-containing protein [Turicibacter sp.]|nr:LysM peptidoglycan-binding domain-containing protein [Turicibacter sp.]
MAIQINRAHAQHHGNDNAMTQIIVHHTTSSLSLLQYRNFFRNSKRWARDGYHYLIRKNGAIYQFTDERSRSWGAGVENATAIHIALNGNFEHQRPTAKQKKALKALIRDIATRRGIPIERVRGHGHIPGQATACPGRNMPRSVWANALAVQAPTPVAGGTHTVRAGESLSVIAQRFGVTVANLQAWNNIQNANLIRVGQVLRVGNQRTHTVVSGDTLWNLSQRFGVSVNKLKAANGLTNSNINPGQMLVIPG